jgi:hypothetical protein
LIATLSQCKFQHGDILHDASDPIFLTNQLQLFCAGYVDNILIAAGCPLTIDNRLTVAFDTFKRIGLHMHGHVAACKHFSFGGSTFNGECGSFHVKHKKLYLLHRAITELSHRNAGSGKLFESILGHCNWSLLCFRTAFSIFSHAYWFVASCYSFPRPLWSSVI